MWDVIASRDDLSYLRRLLERDLPEVAATLDARNASEVVARRPGELAPYDRDDPGVVPLRNPNTGGYYVDTLFAPTDDAVRALDRYLRRTGETPTEAETPRRTRRTTTRFECSAPGTSPRRRISSRTTSSPIVAFGCPTSRWTNC